MQNCKESCLVKDSNSVLELAIMSVLGDREEQQDNFGYELKMDESIVVVCDGMGGHKGGQRASQIAVKTILDKYINVLEKADLLEFLLDGTQVANERVCELKDVNGNLLNAGTTMVSIVIRNYQLYWNSVGDSRAYLYRDGEFVQITQDHNYKAVLDEKRQMGLITQDEYVKECEKGDALISFLGIGKINLVDYNKIPFALKKDDKIIIMSDGLYKLVKDEEVFRIIDNFSNINEALQALEMKAKRNAKNKKLIRDNMTVAIIKIK